MQQRPALETLKREALDLETQIRQLQVSFFSVFLFSFVLRSHVLVTMLRTSHYSFILFLFFLFMNVLGFYRRSSSYTVTWS